MPHRVSRVEFACALYVVLISRLGGMAMKIADAVNIDDLRQIARRRLPRMVFDFIEGGVEDERCLVANETSFARHRLVPRYMVDTSRRNQSAALFGQITRVRSASRRPVSRHCSVPIATSSWPRPPRQPTSPSSCRALPPPRSKRRQSWHPAHTWYQLYAARDRKISEDMIRRARDAGLSTLVLTVDVPVTSKRERNVRNGFELPLKLKWSKSLEALMHPLWIASYLRRGIPPFENWALYAERAPIQRDRRLRGTADSVQRNVARRRELSPAMAAASGHQRDHASG